MSLQHLRVDVCKVNQALPAAGLVTVHSGNASGYDQQSDTVVIKPSGVDYDALTPADLVAVKLSSGEVVGSSMRPSVDLPHHLYIYRHMPDVRAVVHTHSNYATAFAACRRAIPVVLTAIADEFGGEVPCAPYTDNEGDNIGEAVLRHKSDRAPAVLLANHGVFAWGATPRDALKAAVMVEDVAKTAWLASQLGDPAPLSAEEVEKWWDRYQKRYGQ
ncbi:MAG: L-ribulose-5-phosphate 4-epimerase [Fimbriimonadaceae bacterium]